MPKKDDAVKFQVGDDVFGAINSEPTRGKVVAVKGDTITIQRRGASIRDARSNQQTKGAVEQLDAPAADFELLYRKQPITKETK
jgi:hypothetical protein